MMDARDNLMCECGAKFKEHVLRHLRDGKSIGGARIGAAYLCPEFRLRPGEAMPPRVNIHGILAQAGRGGINGRPGN
jgi:hypothetical protein